MKEKIENALNEARILVLGVQVLIGFQLQAVFQKSFSRLPEMSRNMELIGLAVLMVTLTLLLAPAAYQRIIEEGNLSTRFHRFISRMIEWALLPFAAALGMDAYIAARKEGNPIWGIACGAGLAFTALFFWYGLEALVPGKRDRGEKQKMRPEEEQREQTPLADKIKFVLTETRVVLPGAQALLGFQFAVLLMEPFEQMPAWARYLHLASLLIVGLSTILLMAPAAYHRIVEAGEDSERLHDFTSHILLAAMATLALGMSGDLCVVLYKGTQSLLLSLGVALLSLALAYGLWFGYMLHCKARYYCSAAQPAKPATRNIGA